MHRKRTEKNQKKKKIKKERNKKYSGVSAGNQRSNIKELSILSLATMNHNTLFILKYETITF